MLIAYIVSLLSTMAYSQAVYVLQNPTSSQTIAQPSGTTFSVNRMENIRFAEQFASGSSTGGIQEAINDLPNGGTVMLPASTITITSTINITHGVTVRGHGLGVTAISLNSTTADVFYITAPGVTMTDFNITRPSNVLATAGAGIHINYNGDAEAHIARVNMLNQFNGLLTESGTTFVFVDECWIEGNQSHGAIIQGNDTRFTRNRFYTNGFGSGGSGVAVLNLGAVVSSGNEFYGNAGHGIYYAGSTTTLQSFHTGDIVDSNGDVGIVVTNEDVVTFNDGWIASNGTQFDGNHNPTYVFNANIDGADCYNTAHHCQFNNNQITTNSRHGILFYGSQDFQASNNHISKNGLGGGSSSSEIAVVNYPGVSWQDGRLEGNRCWNSGGGQKYGINLQGTGTAIIVIGNDLLGNATSSLSDTSSGASKIITNNICTSGPC